MRIFLALLPDDDARQALVATQGMLAPLLARGKATSADNLHLTLAFLGELDEEAVARARMALHEAASASEPFRIALGGVGAFERRHGSVVWRGIADDEERASLMGLQARLAESLRGRGFDVPCAYVPHMTLFRNARASEGHGLSELQGIVQRALPKARFEASAAHVMLSHHPEGGRLAYDSLFEERLSRTR